MAIPSTSDLRYYVATPLDNIDWKFNWDKIIAYLTDGTSDVTLLTMETLSDVTIGGDLQIDGDFDVGGSQTATEIITTYGFYHPRGAVSGFDVSYPFFNNDNTWRELDLSTIAPVGTKAVHITGRIFVSVANATMLFKAYDDTSTTYVLNGACGGIAGYFCYYTAIVPLDTNRKAKYKNDGCGSTNDIVVTGWWK